jgi:hypothetical protein
MIGTIAISFPRGFRMRCSSAIALRSSTCSKIWLAKAASKLSDANVVSSILQLKSTSALDLYLRQLPKPEAFFSVIVFVGASFIKDPNRFGE